MSIHSLLSNPDIDDKYDEFQSIIDSDRSVLQSTNKYGQLPIHVALVNPHTTLRIIKLLLNGWPELISQPDQFGNLPIHYLCDNEGLDEALSVDILSLLLESSPESVEHRDSRRRVANSYGC